MQPQQAREFPIYKLGASRPPGILAWEIREKALGAPYATKIHSTSNALMPRTPESTNTTAHFRFGFAAAFFFDFFWCFFSAAAWLR